MMFIVFQAVFAWAAPFMDGKDWAGAHSTTFVSVYHLGKVCFKYQQSWPGTEKCSYFHFFSQGAGGEGTGRGWGCQPLLNNAIIGCHYFLLFFDHNRVPRQRACACYRGYFIHQAVVLSNNVSDVLMLLQQVLRNQKLVTVRQALKTRLFNK